MHSKFWLIIKDDSKRTFEVCGQESNTDPFSNRTIAMQRAGMNVSCVFLPVGTKNSSKSLIKFTGYTVEEGLHDRLKKAYQVVKQREIEEEGFGLEED